MTDAPGILALSRVRFPDAELGELFVRSLLGRARLADGFPGFRGLRVLSPARADGDWVLETAWDTRDDLHRWLRSAEHERTHDRTPEELRPYLWEARVEVYEIRDESRL